MLQLLQLLAITLPPPQTCDACRAAGRAWCRDGRCVEDQLLACGTAPAAASFAGPLAWACPPDDDSAAASSSTSMDWQQCQLMGRLASLSSRPIAEASQRIATSGWIRLRREGGAAKRKRRWCEITNGSRLDCFKRPSKLGAVPATSIELTGCALGRSTAAPRGVVELMLTCSTTHAHTLRVRSKEQAKAWSAAIVSVLIAQLCERAADAADTSSSGDGSTPSSSRLVATVLAAAARTRVGDASAATPLWRRALALAPTNEPLRIAVGWAECEAALLTLATGTNAAAHARSRIALRRGALELVRGTRGLRALTPIASSIGSGSGAHTQSAVVAADAALLVTWCEGVRLLAIASDFAAARDEAEAALRWQPQCYECIELLAQLQRCTAAPNATTAAGASAAVVGGAGPDELDEQADDAAIRRAVLRGEPFVMRGKPCGSRFNWSWACSRGGAAAGLIRHAASLTVVSAEVRPKQRGGASGESNGGSCSSGFMPPFGRGLMVAKVSLTLIDALRALRSDAPLQLYVNLAPRTGTMEGRLAPRTGLSRSGASSSALLAFEGVAARLYDRTPLPPFLRTASLTAVNAWIGAGADPVDTASQAHFDATHNVLVVVAGKKRVVLYPSSAAKSAARMVVPRAVRRSIAAGGGGSTAGALAAMRSSNFAKVGWRRGEEEEEEEEEDGGGGGGGRGRGRECTVTAGDALFIPRGWLHEVHSAEEEEGELHVGLSIWFDALAAEEEAGAGSGRGEL